MPLIPDPVCHLSCIQPLKFPKGTSLNVFSKVLNECTKISKHPDMLLYLKKILCVPHDLTVDLNMSLMVF